MGADKKEILMGAETLLTPRRILASQAKPCHSHSNYYPYTLQR